MSLKPALFPVLLALSLFLSSVGCKRGAHEESSPEPTAVRLEPTQPEVQAPAASAFPAVSIPMSNPQTLDKIALGHQLFFDKRLSVDGSRACYSCHQNEHGNGGQTPLAIGANNKKLTRHSPMMWNVAMYDAFYWDGRSSSLEAQVKGAWGGGNMGVGKDNLQNKTDELATIAGYKSQFDKAFPDEGMTADTVAKAIAAYERTLICDDTAYDKFIKGDPDALDQKQKRGYDLFMGEAKCVLCHAPPSFSNATNTKGGLYYNIGIGTAGKAQADVDIGRMKITGQTSDWAAFKVPTLRNISKSAPYFHDGSVATLRQAAKLMATGGTANKNKTPLLTDSGLSDRDLNAVVAFLGALDCNKALEVPNLPK